MVLVRRRTHLKTYEQALRSLSIPFLTSRRGGLLDTLEASDIQALLTFLITPFADLALAQTLRTPIFSCSDEELMRIAAASDEVIKEGEGDVFRLAPQASWWLRLNFLVDHGQATPALLRACHLLTHWIVLADKLPVHDLLDRIYFEGDAKSRYAAAVPTVMRASVLANLQAFLEIALTLDAGRYPSLPGFLREMAQLRKADDNESPDEGKISQAGNAVRIYTVHESKGLEAPIVWLLDTNARPPADRGYDVLVDWPTNATRPVHFSLYGDKASRGAVREHYFAQEALLAQREDLNLLYVAMTRARQVLMVSGSGVTLDGQWYQRIKDAVGSTSQAEACMLPVTQYPVFSSPILESCSFTVDERLCQSFPVGKRKSAISDAQRQGIWLHGLLQYLAESTGPIPVWQGAITQKMQDLQQKLSIPAALMPELLHQAQTMLNAPQLKRFFDNTQYLVASNEVAYVNACGQLRRIDRLVEFETEVWVLDYKSGMNEVTPSYKAQLEEYRTALQAIQAHKVIRCALIFPDGNFAEV
jgi:ATP-dependent helicase/nuclease subunit A